MDEQDRGSPKRLTTEALEARSTDLAARPREATLWPEHEQVLGVDLKRLLGLVWARKLLFAGMFTTIVAAALLVILSFPPQYEAMSKVVIAPDEPIVEVRSMTAPLSTESQAVESQIEIISSKSLVGPVIDEIGFRRHLAAPLPPSRLELLLGLPPTLFPEIRERLAAAVGLDATATEELADDKVFRAFYDRLEIERVPNTSVITIGFEATDPAIAAGAANQLVQRYVEIRSKRNARAGRMRSSC